jgi:arylsulfatase A-like enzyme
VPLVIVPPSRSPRPARPVISENVSVRDLPATVVDLLHLEAGAPFPGESLARLWDRDHAPATTTIDLLLIPPSPALSVVVPTNPLDPDPARVLESRQVWASLAEGDWAYIRREDEVREELYNLREDPKELHNLAADPAMQPRIAQMRKTLHLMTAGPLTRERLNP